MTQKQIKEFQKKVLDFYRENKRNLPWRNTQDPYKIFISEVMLQQTQVNRVLQKYNNWLKVFPDFESLSNAKFITVLAQWNGLGYNRRAKFLFESARIISNQWKKSISDNPEDLIKLPGIGKATASSIIVFAYNKPLVFIETNIRRVFIHEFFKSQKEVNDKEIIPMIEKTLDINNPREWYYALMDYGAFLGRTTENPNRRSKNYSRQSQFTGSVRQVRGEILRILSQKPMKITEIEKTISGNPDHFPTALEELLKESFLEKRGDTIQIKDHG